MQHRLLHPAFAKQPNASGAKGVPRAERLPAFLRRCSFPGQPRVPGEAEQVEGANDPGTHRELPPAQAVAGGGREGVVRIVPAFPHGQDAEQEAVPAPGITAVSGATRTNAALVAGSRVSITLTTGRLRCCARRRVDKTAARLRQEKPGKGGEM